jgi:hypothetical protein
MAPGLIPKGTLLYHGAVNETIPTVPEWTATDLEHSILTDERIMLVSRDEQSCLVVIYKDVKACIDVAFG